MHQYEGDQIQFNLLALCRSPQLSIPEELATNICALAAVERALERIQPDWKQFIDMADMDNLLRGPDLSFRITQEQLNNVRIPEPLLHKVEGPAMTPSSLLKIRQDLESTQVQLRLAFIEEAAAIEQDDERTMARRHDYTPVIHTWIKMLADKGLLKSLLQVHS